VFEQTLQHRSAPLTCTVLIIVQLRGYVFSSLFFEPLCSQSMRCSSFSPKRANPILDCGSHLPGLVPKLPGLRSSTVSCEPPAKTLDLRRRTSSLFNQTNPRAEGSAIVIHPYRCPAPFNSAPGLPTFLPSSQLAPSKAGFRFSTVDYPLFNPPFPVLVNPFTLRRPP